MRFSEELKNLESEILLVAGLSFSDCTLGLNTGDKITLSLQKFHSFYYKIEHADTLPLQRFSYRVVRSARCCKLKTALHQNNQTVATKFGKTVSHRNRWSLT